MKYFIVILFTLCLLPKSYCQQKSYPFYQLYQLDSIGQSPSISRHFGSLYFNFLQLIEKKLANADSTTKRFIRHFEIVFAQFYIDACSAYSRNEQIPLPAWRAYFSDSTLQFFQYYLLGANAHLNGGLAEAIAGSYTQAEWMNLKKKYILFNKCLNQTFNKVYTETITNSKRAKLLSVNTFGFAKPAGQYYLYKWRKRQMRLTEYYYEKSDNYKRLLHKINRKKEKIDRLVFTQF